MKIFSALLRRYLRVVEAVSYPMGFCSGCVMHALASATLTAGFAYGYSLGTIHRPPSRLLLVLIVSVLFAMLVHGVLYGMLTRAGIPSPFLLVNRINDMFRGPRLKDGFRVGDYVLLHKRLTRLPTIRILSSLMDVTLVVTPVIVYDYFYAEAQLTLHFVIIALVALPIHAQFCFVTADLHLARFRSRVKRKIFELGQKPPVSRGLSLKFKFVLVLSVVLLAAYITITLMRPGLEAPPPTMRNIILFSIYALFLLLVLAALHFSSIFNSIGELQKAARLLSKGKDPDFFPAASDRELADLSAGFFNAAQKILGYQKNLERRVEERTEELRRVADKLQKKDALVQQELTFAADIQKGILPVNLEPWKDIRFAATYMPMGKVSGDYYDVVRRDDCVYVLIADVSGHGVPAAFITMAAKQAFQAAIAKHDMPADIFAEVNSELCKRIQTSDYLTAFLIRIDSNYRVVYANAAHQKALHFSRSTGQSAAYDTSGLFIGALEQASASYANEETTLHPGDRLVLYTDGVIEQRNQHGDEFGHERLVGIYRENMNLPLDESNRQVMLDLMQYMIHQDVKDDITILSMERAP